MSVLNWLPFPSWVPSWSHHWIYLVVAVLLVDWVFGLVNRLLRAPADAIASVLRALVATSPLRLRRPARPDPNGLPKHVRSLLHGLYTQGLAGIDGDGKWWIIADRKSVRDLEFRYLDDIDDHVDPVAGAAALADQAPTPDSGGAVYFVQAGPGGPVKIGWSTNLPSRLKTLETGNHEELRLLASYPASLRHEQMLHDRFRVHHVRGEWFRAAPVLMTYVARWGAVSQRRMGSEEPQAPNPPPGRGLQVTQDRMATLKAQARADRLAGRRRHTGGHRLG